MILTCVLIFQSLQGKWGLVVIQCYLLIVSSLSLKSCGNKSNFAFMWKIKGNGYGKWPTLQTPLCSWTEFCPMVTSSWGKLENVVEPDAWERENLEIDHPKWSLPHKDTINWHSRSFFGQYYGHFQTLPSWHWLLYLNQEGVGACSSNKWIELLTLLNYWASFSRYL